MAELPDGAQTILALTGIGIAPWSARGLSEDLQLATPGNLRRTVNGALEDLSLPQFRKYRATITGSDGQSPAINGVWPGKTVVVDCISEIAYVTAGGAADRPIVPGSERTEDGFTFYRPRLTMMVADLRLQTDEWGAAVGWTLELVEV